VSICYPKLNDTLPSPCVPAQGQSPESPRLLELLHLGFDDDSATVSRGHFVTLSPVRSKYQRHRDGLTSNREEEEDMELHQTTNLASKL
jgi:hypothetical protein